MSMKESLINKKVSIVIPIYNTIEYQLCECINSIRNQTYENIEIILIDDGSEKYIEGICKEAELKDNRIHYYKQENKGVSSARNLGVSKATGDYIMFIDADDWLDEDCIEILQNKTNFEYDIIAFSYIKEFEKHKELISVHNSNVDGKIKSEFYKIYNMHILGTSCMKLYKKEIFENCCFDEELKNAEDVEFNFRAFNSISNFFYVNKYFYHYRIQNQSAVRGFNHSMIENYEKTINKMSETLKQFNDEINQKAYFSFLCIAYLMICLNYVYNVENKNKNKNRRKMLNEIGNKEYFKELFSSIDKIDLPVTRKMPIIFAKFKMYLLVKIVIKIKQIKDKG